jgi:replication initiator protein
MPTAPKQKEITSSELARERVTPFPRQPGKIAPERIRPELNLEKWAIWQPAHSRNKETRTFTRIFSGKEGDERIQQVTVHYVDKVGTLTTEDQKTYYALVKHWEDEGRSAEWTFFSLRQLAKLLNKKWGTNVIDSLTQSLTRLRTIGIVWADAYYDGKTETIRDVLDPFTILSKVKIVRRRTDGHVTTAIGYFRFDDDILNNLQANYTKPVILDTVLSFKSELAQVLYTYLDLILADKSIFERRTKALFEELGLSGTAYGRAGKRKQVLEPALRELQGVILTTGRIASATIDETADGKDYKIVIRKGKLAALPKINHYQEDQTSDPSMNQQPGDEGREATATEQHQEQRPDHEQLLTQSRELVAHFYEVFATGKNFQISSKATAQAISLITQYGFEPSRYIVDYAHREAPKTNFDIKAFGGIIQYSSRALAEYEQHRADQRHTPQSREAIEACELCDQYGMRRLGENTVKRCTHDQATEEAAAQAFTEAERQQQEEQYRENQADERACQYLDQLPQEQYQALFDQVQAEAITQYPSLKQMPNDTRQQMIRRLLIRKVRAEQGYETTCETNETSSNELLETGTDQPIG